LGANLASKIKEINKLEERLSEIRVSMYNVNVHGSEAEAYARNYRDLEEQVDKLVERL
jgi:hypothetical protein